MSTYQARFKRIAELAFPWIFLSVILLYTYVKFFQHPYGFAWETEGNVYKVFVNQEPPTIQIGDHLKQVGALSWDAFNADLHKTFFDGVDPGATVPVTVERDGQLVTIPWRLPGFNQGELEEQLTSEWPLAFVFWLIGTLALLSLRPRDERWWLLSAFNFLTAIWLAAGGGASHYHLWGSAIVLRVAIWICLPIYLHLHWVFPRPLGKLPTGLVWSAYGITAVLVIAQILQLIPANLYYLGFLLAILGSLILLVIHAVRQPDARQDLRLLLIAAAMILAPLIVLSVTGLIYGLSSRLDTLALLSFPLLPISYLYAAYRRQLGGLEIRVNRLLSAYFFLILLGMIGLPLLAATDRAFSAPDSTLFIGAFSAIFAAIASIWGFPRFTTFVEKQLLGIHLPPENILDRYSKRITRTIALSDLLGLLRDEVIPSLLIRQFVFLHFDNNAARFLYASPGIERRLPNPNELSDLLNHAGKYVLPETNQNDMYSWVRLVLQLRLGSELIGLWLFGRHDPDDVYSQAEINLLQALANETAVALSNILQTDRIKSMYKANIDRYEQERLRLSLELHDSVLNELAVLRTSLDPHLVPPRFQEAYERVAQRLREIVSNLRPPMLDYGLRDGLIEMADNLMERSKDMVNVVVDIQTNRERYPADVERHIFRIVQEACENTLRHARAKEVRISGRLDASEVKLSIDDDGIGFDADNRLEVKQLLAAHHFGLAGMLERAELIGAEIHLSSTPETGTSIHILWKPTQDNL